MTLPLDLETPAAVIDIPRMQRNIERMQTRMDALGVRFRPHVKTTKCLPVVQAQLAAGARGITVSTLKEAAYFHEHGLHDILYAVGMTSSKLPRVLSLRRAGCDLKIITDSVESARAIAAFGKEHAEQLDVWIEIDSDGHRSGILPTSEALLEVARTLHKSGMKIGGVMTHAGSSYESSTAEALIKIAEQERSACVHAAERLRAADLPCPGVSVGSTPTALSAQELNGVTEVRAGVYVFFDLVMSNVGVCTHEDIALSVLTTVIGHQEAKGWAIVDAGWMAMSRDRGTASQKTDYGYGQVADHTGRVLPGYILIQANQEHGVLGYTHGEEGSISERFPIGTQLRIFPNHACATGAQFPSYMALDEQGGVEEWGRFHGW